MKPKLGTPLNISHPFSNGLVASYLIQEGSGGIIHDVRRAHNGILANDAIIYPEGLYFPGVNGYVTIPKSIISQVAFSIVLGINFISGSGYIFSDSTDSGNLLFRGNAPNEVYGYVGEVPLQAVDHIPITYGTKYNFVITNDINGIYTYYKDGIKQTRGGWANNFTNLSGAFYLGNRAGLDRDYNGWIYYLHVYNRDLSVSEVNALHINPYQMFYRTPIWMFDYTAAVGEEITQFIFMD